MEEKENYIHNENDQEDTLSESQGRFVKKSISVEQLHKRYRTFRLNFDLAIQRKENIWDAKKQSLLVHSILSDYYVPAIVAIKDESKLNIVDGKQRLSSLFAYITNEFILEKTTPNVNGVTIAGKTFTQLPEQFQKIILTYKFDVSIGENLSDAEIEDLFYRLNNGVPLNTIEITRALLGNKIISFLKDITDHPFFQYKINMSATAKKRYTDQELVLQILRLIYYPDQGLSSKEMKPFIEELKNEDLKAKLKSSMDNALYYLNEAFPKKQKFLKKLHIPMLFNLALDVIHQNYISKIPAMRFGTWAEEFFENPPEDYKKAGQSGSARKENVQIRLRSMREHFNNYFAEELGIEKTNVELETENNNDGNIENNVDVNKDNNTDQTSGNNNENITENKTENTDNVEGSGKKTKVKRVKNVKI